MRLYKQVLYYRVHPPPPSQENKRRTEYEGGYSVDNVPNNFTEAKFLNFQGAQESIPRNQFRQSM